MPPFKPPTLIERQAAQAEARDKALARLKARPPVDEAVVQARREAAARRDAAALAAREAKKAAAEEAKAAALARAEEAARVQAEAAALAPPPPVEKTEAERKAERDRRYAARKSRK